MNGSIETINCVWCDRQAKVFSEAIDKQYSKYGGWFCQPDCKSEYVYAEFEHIMQSQPSE